MVGGKVTPVGQRARMLTAGFVVDGWNEMLPMFCVGVAVPMKLQATSKPTKILPLGKVTGRCERANAVPPCETQAQKFAPPSGFWPPWLRANSPALKAGA